MKTTDYFGTSVRVRRPDIKVEWIEAVLSGIRQWGFVKEIGKYLRVVTEPDGETVHNAFFDRRFKP
jgi:hypothetical protein